MSDSTFIALARPSITDGERAAALRVLSGHMLTGGPERERFEASLASLLGRETALSVSSGTVALELSLRALGIQPGDSVLVTAFGFPAAASAVASQGAQALPVDVRKSDWTIDFDAAYAAVTPSTKALITIDQLGAVTSGEDIERFEKDTGLSVISDAACGLGGHDEDGREAASAGRLACLSFHPRKLVTTGEGGAVASDDADLVQRISELRNLGQDGAGSFARFGTNARLDELSCALGNVQLERLDAMLGERQMLAEGYRERLSFLASEFRVSWQEVGAQARHAYQSFAILLHEDVRTRVIGELAAKGIQSGPATYAFTEIQTFSQLSGSAPLAQSLHRRALALPLYVGMRSKELDRVCDTLEEILR